MSGVILDRRGFSVRQAKLAEGVDDAVCSERVARKVFARPKIETHDVERVSRPVENRELVYPQKVVNKITRLKYTLGITPKKTKGRFSTSMTIGRTRPNIVGMV